MQKILVTQSNLSGDMYQSKLAAHFLQLAIGLCLYSPSEAQDVITTVFDVLLVKVSNLSVHAKHNTAFQKKKIVVFVTPSIVRALTVACSHPGLRALKRFFYKRDSLAPLFEKSVETAPSNTVSFIVQRQW